MKDDELRVRWRDAVLNTGTESPMSGEWAVSHSVQGCCLTTQTVFKHESHAYKVHV